MSDQAPDGGDSDATGAAFGRVDRAGRLVAADPPLAQLHAAAEGEPGGALKLPQLAALAALARRLGVAVARTLVAADEEHDLRLEARAWPAGEEIVVSITGWDTRAAPAADPGADAVRRYDWLRATADWLWQVDEALNLTTLTGADDGVPHLAQVGAPLTQLFRLIADDEGRMPLLDALGEQRGFDRQLAGLIPGGGQYRLAAVPLFDGEGCFRGFRGSAEDDVRPAEAGAGGFGARLDRALRGPLDRIVDSAEAIAAQTEGPLRRDYAAYASDIAVAGRHLRGLIDDLVDIEAIERDRIVARADPFDLADTARRAAALLDPAAAARRIRVDRPGVEEMIAAIGDYRRALQIAVNLLSNAVRYAPEESAVWVRVAREGAVATLVVADQGRGIATEHRERVFDKYDRLDADEPGGSGLGLYIARRLARAMSGELAVDSAPGQGARFTLTLPGG